MTTMFLQILMQFLSLFTCYVYAHRGCLSSLFRH